MIHSDLENPYNFIVQPPYEKKCYLCKTECNMIYN